MPSLEHSSLWTTSEVRVQMEESGACAVHRSERRTLGERLRFGFFLNTFVAHFLAFNAF